MPINVNKCLLDIACNQLISIHLNVEFVEVVYVPLASLSLPLAYPPTDHFRWDWLIPSPSIRLSVNPSHCESSQQDTRNESTTHHNNSVSLWLLAFPLDTKWYLKLGHSDGRCSFVGDGRTFEGSIRLMIVLTIAISLAAFIGKVLQDRWL